MTNQDPNSGKKRERTTIEKPDVAEGATVYDYVVAADMERRMLDIALAQGECPPSLKKDAEQEIRIEWATRKADLEMKPSQVLSYASIMAKHTALRVKRDLGQPVRLPGSAFRKRADGTTYVGIGALAPSLSVDEIEGWFDFTDGHLDPDYARDYLPSRDGNPEELSDAWRYGEVDLEPQTSLVVQESDEVRQCAVYLSEGMTTPEIAQKMGLSIEVVKDMIQHHLLATQTAIITQSFEEVKSEQLTLEEAALKYNVPAGWLSAELKLLAEGVAIEAMQQSKENETLNKRKEIVNRTKEVFKNEDVYHAVNLLLSGERLPTIFKALAIPVKDREEFHREMMETAKRMRKLNLQQKQRTSET